MSNVANDIRRLLKEMKESKKNQFPYPVLEALSENVLQQNLEFDKLRKRVAELEKKVAKE